MGLSAVIMASEDNYVTFLLSGHQYQYSYLVSADVIVNCRSYTRSHWEGKPLDQFLSTKRVRRYWKWRNLFEHL